MYRRSKVADLSFRRTEGSLGALGVNAANAAQPSEGKRLGSIFKAATRRERRDKRAEYPAKKGANSIIRSGSL
jgi:hypothetical protein